MVDGDELRIFDWSDACVSHPLFDLPTFLQRTDDESARTSLLETYLGAWADHASLEELRAAYRACAALSPTCTTRSAICGSLRRSSRTTGGGSRTSRSAGSPARSSCWRRHDDEVVLAGGAARSAPARYDSTVTPDVAVVGGGVTGCSCALALAEAGLKVRLYEAREIAGGASGRNGGFALRGGAAAYPVMVESIGRERAASLWRWTERELEELARLAGDAFRPTGSLRIAADDEERAELEEEYCRATRRRVRRGVA